MLRHSRPFILAAALVIAPALIIVTTPDPARPRARAATISTPDQPEYGLAGIVGPVTEIRAQEAAQVEAARIATEIQQAAAQAASRETRARADVPRSAVQPAPARSDGWSANWDGIARCETGSNWQHLGRADDGSTYDGGLGIYHGAWTDFGGLEFAPRGDLATKEQQIVVAERIYARHGLSGWGCKAYG